MTSSASQPTVKKAEQYPYIIYIILCAVFYFSGLVFGFHSVASTENSLSYSWIHSHLINIHMHFIDIWSNNLLVAAKLICVNPFTIGLGSILILMINGVLLGSALKAITPNIGLLWLLVPHGLFEIPAYFYASLIGFELSYSLFCAAFFNKNIDTLSIAKKFVYLIILITVAAMIETYITPLLYTALM